MPDDNKTAIAILHTHGGNTFRIRLIEMRDGPPLYVQQRDTHRVFVWRHDRRGPNGEYMFTETGYYTFTTDDVLTEESSGDGNEPA